MLWMLASATGTVLPLVGIIIAALFAISYGIATYRNGRVMGKVDVEGIIGNAVKALESQLAVTEKQRDDFRLQLDAANLEIGRLRGHLENVEKEFEHLKDLVSGQSIPPALAKYLDEGRETYRSEVRKLSNEMNSRLDHLEALLREALK